MALLTSLPDVPWTFLLRFALLGSVAYILGLLLRRLLFSPIADFPGPKLAAVTFWYEFYHDVIRGGQYEWVIADMHKRYGPIVRINPHELHIDDPDYYDALYQGISPEGKRLRVDKWPWVMKQFGTDQGAFGTSPHELHRARRGSYASMFSKRSVAQLEPVLQSYVNKMVQRMTELRGTGASINLLDVYAALTGDIVSDYAYGRPMGMLDSADFGKGWHQLIHDFGEMGHVVKQFGIVMTIMDALPEKVALLANPAMAKVMAVHRLIIRQITEIQQRRLQGNVPGEKEGVRKTIFDGIFDSDLPPAEKEPERLKSEGSTLLAAGTGTTADALSKLTYYLLSNPSKLQRLREEIRSIPPEARTLQKLEQLPYLTAVLKEILRISVGVLQRLSRIYPDADIKYRDWTIPRGTPVSMSTWTVHQNAAIFPAPHEFQPERWLGLSTEVAKGKEESETERLERYLVPFGKGTRQCAGLNLAWGELYLTAAAMFGTREFEMRLFETGPEDVRIVCDKFIPGFSAESKGIRVTVH